jgi:hypothetical protein
MPDMYEAFLRQATPAPKRAAPKPIVFLSVLVTATVGMMVGLGLVIVGGLMAGVASVMFYIGWRLAWSAWSGG